jgi:hypothetical protein
VAASSAVGVPAAAAVGDNSIDVAAGGADDVGAAVTCSPRQAQLALNKRRVGYQLWPRTVLRKEHQKRRMNPYQHCCQCGMIGLIPRLGMWLCKKWKCLKTSREGVLFTRDAPGGGGHDDLHNRRQGMHFSTLILTFARTFRQKHVCIPDLGLFAY